MYRYQGNTGRYVWVPDGPGEHTGQPSPQRTGQSAPQRPHQTPQAGGAGASGRRQNGSRSGETPSPTSPLQGLGDSLGNLGSLLSGVFPDGFEMEDALLLLVLFLMYKETGDKELLIIMGAMFLL